METQQEEVSQILNKKFMEIRSRNSNFSLRSYANKINIACGALSQILQRKRRISEEMAIRLSDKLQLNDYEKEIFMRPFKRARAVLEGIEYNGLNYEDEKMCFYHFALLSLIKVESFKYDNEWIAHKLQINEEFVEEIIKSLLLKNLVKVTEEGNLVRTLDYVSTSDNVSSEYLRSLHRINLLKASEALDLPIEVRDFTAMNMAIDPRKIDKARELIRKFQDELSILLESGAQTEVYKLTVQLFPITQKD